MAKSVFTYQTYKGKLEVFRDKISYPLENIRNIKSDIVEGLNLKIKLELLKVF